MKTPAKIVSLIALLATIIPSMLAFAGLIGLEAVKIAALASTIVWFIATPIWMGRELPIDAGEVEI